MKRKTIQPWFLAIVAVCLNSGEAQEVLKLWEGLDKPHYKQNALVEQEKEVWGTRCAADVTEPTITVYPAKDGITGAGVIIIPGGDYSVVAIHHEGYEVARRISDQGIVAAVLKYRLPNPKSSDEPCMVPLADVRRAIQLLRNRADKYGLIPGKVGVLGFSAGSHLATVASLWKSDKLDENPAFSGLIYGVTNPSEENMKWLEQNLYFRQLTREERARNNLLALVDQTTPPAFLVHAYDDDICRVEESTLYAQKLFEKKVHVEMHLFPKGGHGFGAGRRADGTDQWVSLFVAWVKRQ